MNTIRLSYIRPLQRCVFKLVNQPKIQSLETPQTAMKHYF